MDQVSLVDVYIEDGRKLLRQLARDGFDVAVAFWLKSPDDAWWHLFIASRAVGQGGSAEGYRTVQASLQRLPGTTISLAYIKLIDIANPIAGDARRLQKKAAREPVQLRGGQLGNVAVEEAYIYPAISDRMTATEVLQAAFRLMIGRTDSPKPSVITLRDGTTLQAIPTGLDVQDREAPTVKIFDLSTGTERVVQADEVASIE